MLLHDRIGLQGRVKATTTRSNTWAGGQMHRSGMYSSHALHSDVVVALEFHEFRFLRLILLHQGFNDLLDLFTL